MKTQSISWEQMQEKDQSQMAAQKDSWSRQPLFQGPGVQIEGDVRFGADVSIWHNAVVRADSEPVEIWEGSNVQDLCILHTDPGFPVQIGRHVTVGHGAIIHGACIEDDCLIGMGAIVMNGARIGRGSVVAAGALVPEGKSIPPGSLVMGMPGRIVRQLDEKEIENSRCNARHYVQQARQRSGDQTR